MQRISSIRLFLFLLIAVAMYSCEKDNQPGNDNVLTIGNYIGFIVSNLDTDLVGGYHNKKDYFLDIDRDGNNDFVLGSNIRGSPGLGQHPEADIGSLDNLLFFNMIEFQDTSFLHTQNDKINFNQLEIYLWKYYNCCRMDPNDSILSISNDHFVWVPERNQTISANDLWLSDTLDLNNSCTEYNNILSSTQDTIVFEEINYFNESHSLPNDKIAWIGICEKDPEGIN